MTERDQVSGSFRCHDAGESRGFQGIPFWRSVLPHGDNCFCRHDDTRRCDSSSRGDRFRARIDHVDAAFFVDVSQFFQAASSRPNSDQAEPTFVGPASGVGSGTLIGPPLCFHRMYDQ